MNPGGVEKMASDAQDPPASVERERSPAGMELTFQPDDPAAFEEAMLPSAMASQASSSRSGKKISFQPPAVAPPPVAVAVAAEDRKMPATGPPPPTTSRREKPTQFREQFDHLMTRLEDRFQNERLSLEEKHSRELEEAMGYFSLSSGERDAKQQELQMSLMEDIGNMAQQLQELTGTLGADEDGENMTLPSDPKVLEEYAKKMQTLEHHFQKEKVELEQKHATEMEQALGTLKLSRQQREAKTFELQDEISAEIGGMAKQLEELNRAKEAYESKMGVLKQQLSKDDMSGIRPRDPNILSLSQRLSDVERERDSARDDLRRLKLALQVTQGDIAGPTGGQDRPYLRGAPDRSKRAIGSTSPQEAEKIYSLRERIELVERELKEAAQTPGGSRTMRRLRDRMKSIEKDLAAAEESTKEHFALEHLRARMEKVERLLTEGERAAKDWEALEELRNKIGNVDTDLKAVEEAKKEFEALEALRNKMEAVESELKVAEQLASDRENVDKLRKRLGQVEKELGAAEPSGDDHASIDKLLSRLAKAETSLEDARESTKINERSLGKRPPGGRSSEKAGRDEEVERILERLASAEKKLQLAKESAQRRNISSSGPNATRPQSATPFDERQSRIRARLQEHFEESDASQQEPEKQAPVKKSAPGVPGREYRSRFEEPRVQRTTQSDPRDYQQYEGPRYTTQYEAPRGAPSYRDDPRDYPSGSEQLRSTRSRLEEPRDQRAQFEKPEPVDGFSKDHRSYAQQRSEAPAAQSYDAYMPRGAERPLRRRHPGDSSDIGPPKPTTSYSADEEKYAADLEELRYQRALLSHRLKKAEEEEEKKADDLSSSGPKYSWKDAIRNEEQQRMKEKMRRDKSPPKTKLPQKKKRLDAGVQEKVEEETSAKKETMEEDKSGEKDKAEEFKKGGDPPVQAATLNGDSPVQGQSELALSGRDPSVKDSNTPEPSTRDAKKERGVADPPEFSRRPAAGVRKTKSKPKRSPVNPPEEITPVKYPEVFYDAGSISTAELPVSVEMDPSPPKREQNVQGTVTQTPSPPPQELQSEQRQGQGQALTPPPSPPPQPAPGPPQLENQGNVPPPPPPVQNLQSAAAPQQQPIFHQTTVVDGKAAQRERREKDRLMRWIIIVLLCLAIVLAVVIVVVVVLLRGNFGSDDTPQSVAPEPTPFPTEEPFPTPFPSDGNETMGNQTMFPGNETMAPTIMGSSLEQCPMLDSTIPLTTDGVTMQLSTEGASFDPTEMGLEGGCGTIEELGIDGVWYAMIGNGDVVTISTCTQFFPSFDTQMLVYKQANETVGCRDGLECVASNDNFCGQQSSVTFIAQANTLYFVYVSGKTDAPQYNTPTEGEFSLTVSTSPEGSCQGAIGPLIPGQNNQLPVVVVGELLGGTFGVDPCNPDLQTRTGELWYTVTGSDRIVVASTCHSLSNFDARLAVYTGNSCDVLMCVTADDDDCGNGSTINWFAEEGVNYYLLVYSPDFAPDGQFGITVQEIY